MAQLLRWPEILHTRREKHPQEVLAVEYRLDRMLEQRRFRDRSSWRMFRVR